MEQREVHLVVYNAYGVGSATFGVYTEKPKADEHADFLRDLIKSNSIITRPQDTVMVDSREVR